MRTGFSLLYRRRPGIYLFRRIVPKDVRELIGVREIKVSLRTTDADEAKRKAAREMLKADQRIEEARRLLRNPAARAQRLVQETIEDLRMSPPSDKGGIDGGVGHAGEHPRSSPLPCAPHDHGRSPTTRPRTTTDRRTRSSPRSSSGGARSGNRQPGRGWSGRRRGSGSWRSLVTCLCARSRRPKCARSRMHSRGRRLDTAPRGARCRQHRSRRTSRPSARCSRGPWARASSRTTPRPG